MAAAIRSADFSPQKRPESPEACERYRGAVTTVKDDKGKRFVTVEDPQDKVIFEGPVDSQADREKLPREVRECLEQFERAVKEQPGGRSEQLIRELRLPFPASAPEVI